MFTKLVFPVVVQVALTPPANGQPGVLFASPSNVLATTTPAAAVPEPTILLLALSGLAPTGLRRRRVPR